jgi:hypothetical protein
MERRMIFRSAKTKPISIRLPVEVICEYQKRADKEDVALSKVLANACVLWLEAEKQMDLQHAPEQQPVKNTVAVESNKVHLTDPFKYKPHTFFEWD